MFKDIVNFLVLRSLPLVEFTFIINTKYFTATSTTLSFLRDAANVDCVISNVSVKEVGQHWEMNSTAIFTANGINITTGGYIRQDVLTLGKSLRNSLVLISPITLVSISICCL